MWGDATGACSGSGIIAADVTVRICGTSFSACFCCELIITLNALLPPSEPEAPPALAPAVLVCAPLAVLVCARANADAPPPPPLLLVTEELPAPPGAPPDFLGEMVGALLPRERRGCFPGFPI